MLSDKPFSKSHMICEIILVTIQYIILITFCALVPWYFYLLVEKNGQVALSDIVLTNDYNIGYKTESQNDVVISFVAPFLSISLIAVICTHIAHTCGQARQLSFAMGWLAIGSSALSLVMYPLMWKFSDTFDPIEENTYNTDWSVYIDTPAAPSISCATVGIAVFYEGNLTDAIGYDVYDCTVYSRDGVANGHFTQCCAAYSEPNADIEELIWLYVKCLIIFQSVFVVGFSLLNIIVGVIGTSKDSIDALHKRARYHFCNGRAIKIENTRNQGQDQGQDQGHEMTSVNYNTSKPI